MTHFNLPHLKTRTFGRPTFHQPEVDSTQDLLKKLVDDGAKEGTIVLSDHQSAGRGRQKRTWFSLPGPQIFCSILLRPSLPSHRWPLINIVAGLALRRTLQEIGIATA
ncbi:MAG TPA: hypothetical protein VI895_00535, partial [Bdellovibrionota bacterium]|nr:hypothetical protein [Bdellovibrionota bacterium]